MKILLLTLVLFCVFVSCLTALFIVLWNKGRRAARAANEKSSGLEKELEQYATLKSLEAEEKRLSGVVGGLKRQEAAAHARLREIQSQVVVEEEKHEMELAGMYNPEFDMASSQDYKTRLDELKDVRKRMVKAKTAVICTTEWRVNGDLKAGQRQIDRTSKLALSAFNTQVDNIILKVTYKNLERSLERLQKVADNVDKLIEPQACHLSPEYIKLRVQEVELSYKYAEKRQHEKELEKERKEAMREEERERKLYEADLARLDKEAERYERELERAKQEALKAKKSKEEMDALFAKIAALEGQLEDAQEKQRSVSQAQMTRRGHVYVISNIGSFGEGVYKIGMTRRLDPMIRVKELGDASVPFKFDVHAMIFSTDAPGLEKALHKKFDQNRLNRVNRRKEFFRVHLDEIERVARQFEPGIEFYKEHDAKEYMLSLDSGVEDQQLSILT